MRRATVALLVALAVPVAAGADPDRSRQERQRLETERVEAAQGTPFPLPGPLYDEAGRMLAAPPPSDLRSARDVWRRVLSPVAGRGPGRRAAPPRRVAMSRADAFSRGCTRCSRRCCAPSS
jgi:hypothetical protein